MFVSQAHSFHQQARLAITLAWVGGYTNIVSIITCGTVTSHASGTTSNLGHDLFNGDWALAAFAAFLLLAFFAGAAISGFCTEIGRRRAWESIYVVPMIAEVLLLMTFALLIEWWGIPPQTANLRLYLLIGLAAAAMGLQNATITRISSGVVRTTHVTGVLTDLGHETAQFVFWLFDRRRDIPPGSPKAVLYSVFTHPPARRLALLAAILGSFALGAGLGTLAYAHMPRLAMFPPCAFLLWIIYQDLTVPIAEIEASTLVGGSTGIDLPDSLAVFHLRKDHDRSGRVHRMPNLLSWYDRLPQTVRVVVLDLAEVTELDENAIGELRALAQRFESHGRQLILAGLSEQFQKIQLAGATDLVASDNLCSDLELAIARGLNLTQ